MAFPTGCTSCYLHCTTGYAGHPLHKPSNASLAEALNEMTSSVDMEVAILCVAACVIGGRECACSTVVSAAGGVSPCVIAPICQPPAVEVATNGVDLKPARCSPAPPTGTASSSATLDYEHSKGVRDVFMTYGTFGEKGKFTLTRSADANPPVGLFSSTPYVSPKKLTSDTFDVAYAKAVGDGMFPFADKMAAMLKFFRTLVTARREVDKDRIPDVRREIKPPAEAGAKRKRAAKSRTASAAGVPLGSDN